MKALLQIILICLAGSAVAQNIELPQRATNAPTAEAFAEHITPLDLSVREREITTQIYAGNVPDFLRKLCPVTVTNVADGITNTGTFLVTSDYLAIGSDTNYLLMPISGNTAQRIADKLDCVLPTRKMVDAIYAAAELKLAPSPMPPTAAMTTVPQFVAHNDIVRTQRMAVIDAHPLGALVAGHKKDVVVTARLNMVTNKIAIYGWHRLTNGVAIQPLFLGHVAWWVDYSQCIRLVSQTMLVNGEPRQIADVLADPKLCGLISDEGAVTNARYPTSPVSPAFSEKINLPWPQKFIADTNSDELTREIRLPDDVRIVINAPERGAFSPEKPVELIFFALPNGNSIEQTAGKTLQPGDDWHFDIQHIGAQTRWLRTIVTNRTLVIAYLEAGGKSWPTWRKMHEDKRIAEIIDGVREIFKTNKTEVVLASHSGGGSLMFGYLNAVAAIPDDVKRIAFLDSDYGYETDRHAEKIKHWLAAATEHRLCVLAYQDYVALLNDKTFVSEAGGTWGRSQVMLGDLRTQFQFNGMTNDGLETVSTVDRQVEFLLKENPEKKIWHTVQVERNGFIQALLSGTPNEGKGYDYLGERAYTNWIR